MRYTFGELTLDAQRFELKRGGELLPLEPKVFDVLCYLVRERERVVSKDELLAALWPDEHVVDAVVVRCIYEARKALGQDDVYAAPIATVRARGYRFIADVTASDDTSDAARPEPFVGRASILQRLSAALADARAGHGRLILLSGEPGIGKTRLAEELAAHARRAGVDVLIGHCHEGDSAPSFWPFTEIVRGCMRVLAAEQIDAALGASRQHLRALLPEAGVAGERALERDGAQAGSELLLFDAVVRLLHLAAERRPRMLLLDDLHWADVPSLRLLSFLARDIGETALLVVGTLRDRELGNTDPRKSRLDQLGRLRRVERVALAPLEQADVRAYVTNVFGRELPELSRALYERSEGSPFFMVEALRPHLSEPSAAIDTAQLALPDASRDIVRERLVRLPELTRALLASAAVNGRAFEPSLVARLHDRAAGSDDAWVLSALAPAIERGLVRVVPEGLGQLEFTHAFMREVIYDELEPGLRLSLHAKLAEVLSRRSLPPYAEIAFHLRHALPLVDHATVAQHCAHAGRAAAAQHAYHDAASHYEDALRSLALCQAGPQPERELELLLALGHAYRKAGEAERAVQTFERAAQKAKAAARAVDFARAVLGLRDSQPLRATQATPIETLLLEALRTLPESELVLRTRVSSRLAAVGPRERRREMSARATTLARGTDDAATQADVLNARLAAAQDPDEAGERLAIADELERLARAHAEPDWLWEAHAARFDAYLRLGDMPAALRALDACARVADELHHAVMHMEVLRHRAQRALFEGRYAEVERGMAEAAELRGHVAHGLADVHAAVQTLWLMRDRGQLGMLGEEMEIFLARHAWAAEMARAAIALAYAEKADHVRAREGLDFYARTGFDNVPYGKDYVATCAHLAETAYALGDRDAAARIYAMLAPYAKQNVVDRMLLCFGSASYYLGVLAELLGRADQARAHLEDALAMNARMGALPALARTQRELGTLLERTGADRQRAAELMRESRELSQRIGMQLSQSAAPRA